LRYPSDFASYKAYFITLRRVNFSWACESGNKKEAFERDLSSICGGDLLYEF